MPILELCKIAFVQASFSSADNRQQRSKKVNIALFYISDYLPFSTFVYN